MKKAMMVLLCIAMAGMVLSGCAARNMSGTTATAAPIVTNSPMPTAQKNTATIAPDATDAVTSGMTGTTGSTGLTGTTDTMNGGTMTQAGNAQSMTKSLEYSLYLMVGISAVEELHMKSKAGIDRKGPQKFLGQLCVVISNHGSHRAAGIVYQQRTT